MSNALQRDGTDYRVALLAFEQPGAPVFPQVLPAFPAGILSNVTTMDPGIESGVGRQFDLQIERQFASRTTVHAAYIHLSGDGILMSRNVNVPTLDGRRGRGAQRGQPGPARSRRWATTVSTRASAGPTTTALTLSLRHTGGRWGSHRASYTLSKTLDNAGNAFFSSPQNNFDVDDDYGRSDNDQRHRLVLSGAVTPAWGLDLSYIFAAASAPPFNIQTGGDRNGDTTVNDRPAGVARNTGEGFASATLDLRVGRRFAAGGGHTVEVTLDAFNVLNQTNYLIPNNIIGTGPTPPAAFGRADGGRRSPAAAGWPAVEFLMRGVAAAALVLAAGCVMAMAQEPRTAVPPAVRQLGVAAATNAHPAVSARGSMVALAWGATTAGKGTDVYVSVSRDAGVDVRPARACQRRDRARRASAPNGRLSWPLVPSNRTTAGCSRAVDRRQHRHHVEAGALGRRRAHVCAAA